MPDQRRCTGSPVTRLDRAAYPRQTVSVRDSVIGRSEYPASPDIPRSPRQASRPHPRPGSASVTERPQAAVGSATSSICAWASPAVPATLWAPRATSRRRAESLGAGQTVTTAGVRGHPSRPQGRGIVGTGTGVPGGPRQRPEARRSAASARRRQVQASAARTALNSPTSSWNTLPAVASSRSCCGAASQSTVRMLSVGSKPRCWRSQPLTVVTTGLAHGGYFC